MRDLAIGFLLAAVVGGAALARSAQLHPVIYQYHADRFDLLDLWFDGDPARYACLVLDERAAAHGTSTDHPLISVAIRGPSLLVGTHAAANTFQRTAAVLAALWTGLFFGLLRRSGLPHVDAVLFCLLGAVSSAGMMWMAALESFVIGSATLLLPLWMIAGGRTPGLVAETAASAASLSITTSNWMSGLLMSFARRPWREALQIAANALLAVTLLWSIQQLWFPRNEYFLGSTRMLEFAMPPYRPAMFEAMRAFAIHAMVMPTIRLEDVSDSVRMSVQDAAVGSSGWLGVAATIGWLCLLILGVRQMLRRRPLDRFAIVLAGTLVGQLLLHLVVGRETFLYAMHYLPLLILVAARTAIAPAPTFLRPLVITLVILIGVNNVQQFQRAVSFVDRVGHEAVVSGALIQPGIDCPY